MGHQVTIAVTGAITGSAPGVFRAARQGRRARVRRVVGDRWKVPDGSAATRDFGATVGAPGAAMKGRHCPSCVPEGPDPDGETDQKVTTSLLWTSFTPRVLQATRSASVRVE